jgi:carboxypeptidase T
MLPLMRPSRSALAILVAAVVAAAGHVAGPSSARAAEPEFPVGQEAFHTYAEMAQVVADTEAAFPHIVQRFSIGTSYQGRELWAAKVSDNVDVDETEPEVLFDGLHHGDEHMSLEMTLAILRTLTEGYGVDERITKIVDSREIWIVFAVNPDGATYDITNRKYRDWRKNRQPTPNSTAIGTDLNRNYDYRWGCCGGMSTDPKSSRFGGRSAFSAPETRAFRDFVKSRVVGGRQQIRAAISFHTTGRLVMWPYGHTKTDVPSDMTKDDRAVFATLGTAMAKSNGYKPIQASDLYITAGTSRDWLYGRYRVFSFTFELSPDSTPYPDASKIPSETGRNLDAVLTLIERASCPYSIIGKTKTHCGPFFDDFEIGRGWTVNPYGTDTATSGRWERGNPAATTYQLTTTTSGSRALVTGAKAGSKTNAYDVDGGMTTIRSQPVTLPATVGALTFRYYLAHAANSSSADYFRAYIEGPTGTLTLVKQELGAANTDKPAWATVSVPLTPWAGQTIRIVFRAADGAKASTVEAAVDDVRITRP